jgi:hypothetical protein
VIDAAARVTTALLAMASIVVIAACSPVGAQVPTQRIDSSGCGNTVAIPSPIGTIEAGALATLQGVLLTSSSDGSNRALRPDAMIGLYCGGFGLAATEPTVAAVTITEDDGSFEFDGVRPGRYFLTPLLVPAFMGGAFVELDPGQTLYVELTGCTDCPPPV